MEKVIELEHIYVKRDKNVILDDISLSVYKNDFLALIGSNGSGKTTLLKVLAGVIKPNYGKIFLPSNNKNPKIGYLPQKIPLILNSPVTVKEIIETGINSLLFFLIIFLAKK